MESNRNEILQDNFFPYFRVDSLIEIHQALEEDFNILAVSYASMNPILEKYKVGIQNFQYFTNLINLFIVFYLIIVLLKIIILTGKTSHLL